MVTSLIAQDSSLAVRTRGVACGGALLVISLVVVRVNVTDRSGQIGGIRFRYTSPIWSKIGPNRLNSKGAVQPVRIGLPAG